MKTNTTKDYKQPINLVNVNYKQTGQSKSTNQYGMREMQEKAFEARSAQYLLLKAPPASGKSRALMFLALDKLINQGIKKVIVAVPERSIGNSFAPTELSKYGFFADWDLNLKYNLCSPGSDTSKVQAFKDFMQSEDKILICTHATLRFAFEGLTETDFNNRNFLITGIIAMTAVISIFISEYENSKIQILGLISVLLSVEILKIVINWNVV